MAYEMTMLFIELEGELEADSTTDARSLAEKILKKIGQRKVFEMAVSDLTGRIEQQRRTAQQKVERAAEKSIMDLGPVHGPDPETSFARECRENNEALKEERRNTLHKRMEEVFNNPILCVPNVKKASRPDGDGLYITWDAEEELIAFIEFLGERYQGWYKRGVDLENDLYNEGRILSGASHWNTFERVFFVDPDHPERRGGMALSNYLIRESTDQYVESVKKEIRMELTQELLSSVFAMGDGRKVSWANATVADHEKRLSMLKKDVSGTAETAARHAWAVETLRAAGADTLGSLKAD